MLKRNLSVVIYFTLLLCSCEEKELKTQQTKKVDSTQNHSFFPVTEYILGQLSDIETLPVTPLKIISYKGKKDSIWMKKENIRAFAEPFLHPVIDSANFKKLFIEKSFLDQTLNAITFSYDPSRSLPDSVQIRRWDVYIDPDRETVKRIYIVKQLNTTPTQTIQLTWKSDNFCQITTITEKPNSQPGIKEEKLIWNFDD